MEAQMTTTADVRISSSTEDQLRSALRLDAVVVGLIGIVMALTPTAWYGDLPAWLSRAAGLALVLSAIDVAVMAQWSGKKLRVAATVVAELAFAWTIACVVVMATADLTTGGLEVVGVSALATLVFGVLELRLARRLR
jgi:hypothetical protein